MATTWIITTTENISDLVKIGRDRGDSLTAVVVGDAAVAGVDQIIRIPQEAGVPLEAAAPAVVAVVSASADDAILAGDTPIEHVLAGAVAAELNAPVLTKVCSLGQHQAQIARFGAITWENLEFAGPVVAICEAGSASQACQCSEGAPASSSETTASAAGTYQVKIAEENISDVAQVDISHASRVVCAGRGFAAIEDLELAKDLANALGAEFGVSRPLAEGYGWMPRDSYIGISGHVIAPELYVAAGISGQIHHTAGINDSGVIVAINNDELATIFDFADYGIVGDLYQVLPELTAAVQN